MASGRAEDVQLALQRARDKIRRLQLQLSEETSSEETSSAWTPSKELRDSLVDMYRANPRVNQELRQRLPSPAAQPPSSSTQPPRSSTQPPSSSTQQPSSSTQQLLSSTQQLLSSTQPPSSSTQPPSSSTQPPRSSTQQLLSSTQPPSSSTQQLLSSTQPPRSSTQQLLSSTQQLLSSTQQPSSSTQQPSDPFRSGISLDVSDCPQAPLSSCSPSPLSHRRSVSPISPVSHRRSVSPISPVSHRRSVSPVSALSSRPAGGGGRMELDLSPSRGPSPRAESCGDVLDGGGASRGPVSPAPRRHLVLTEDSSPPGGLSALQTFDRDKNISFLLKELDSLREINKKLQEELLQREEELQRRELEEQLREEQKEARDWERPAALLDEVLASQRDRDQALMSRLLLANEERDEAVLRARRLQQAAESEEFPLEDTDQDVEELLQSVCDADSAQEVHQFGSILVQRLRMAKQRRNDITAQEMKAVMEERDSSIAKWKRLEQEVTQEREQRASETERLRLQRERGGAPEDQQRLEAELQVLRANHSSHHVLAPQAPPPHAPQAPPPHAPQAPPPQTPQAPPLLEQLQQLSKDKQSVEAELQRCQEAERDARERVHRLERLVEVLRKKVGTGSLRAVI